MEFWPGPMEGVMTPALIRAARELELVSRWMTPFYRVNSGTPKQRILAAFLAPFAGPLPVTVQLMGTDPAAAAQCAAAFADLGVRSFNLNFGCPSRQVTSGGAGGGALRDPAAMLRMTETVKAAIPALPLSVKLRTGWNDPREQQTFLPALARSGCVDAFFVHYRTVKELYRPAEGRYQRLNLALELASPIPVILNGDVNTPEDAQTLLAALPPAAGIMCARGWLHDPFLLRRLEGKTAPDPESGREQLFRSVIRDNFPVAHAIELSNFLWGKENNPYFHRLIQLPPHSILPPSLTASWEQGRRFALP